ncbi:hypothetical protein [Pyrococcus horikoshii]|nr:hypothetical protein [Pyrococcus horikoshii]HII61088.1 hypothetical protein [Pyrococcus horikoshii]
MLLEVATYSPLDPPKFPKFKMAKFKIDRNTLVFQIKPMGEISINIRDIRKIEGKILDFFDPPRKGIEIELTNIRILITIGDNPLAYSKETLLNFLATLYSTLLNGAFIEYERQYGTLKVIKKVDNGYELALITEKKIIPVKDWKKVENPEIKTRVREFLELLNFLTQEEQEQ